VLCRGDKGQPIETTRNFAAVRRKEMAASAKLLRADLLTGDIPDGTLTDIPTSRLKLVEVYRKFEPTLVLGHAPEDYHPDHRAASAIAEAASWFCASRGHRTRSPVLKSPPALWWMDALGMSGFTPGFYVDVSDFIDMKSQMLACHKSQLARGRDADFSSLAEIMRLQSRARGMQAGVTAAEAFRAHFAFKRGRAW
jgi:LmbE family N-acetylglucosaminyl deacetylase